MSSSLETVAGIKFGILSPEIIRRMSVAEIQNPDTYDEDGMPIPVSYTHLTLPTTERV